VISHLRTSQEHVARAWDLLREELKVLITSPGTTV
jgi:hypothetical protein